MGSSDLEIFKSQSQSLEYWDFRDLALGIFSRFSYPDPDLRDFRDFSLGIFSGFSNLDLDPEKIHPEANSWFFLLICRFIRFFINS